MTYKAPWASCILTDSGLQRARITSVYSDNPREPRTTEPVQKIQATEMKVNICILHYSYYVLNLCYIQRMLIYCEGKH